MDTSKCHKFSRRSLSQQDTLTHDTHLSYLSESGIWNRWHRWPSHSISNVVGNSIRATMNQGYGNHLPHVVEDLRKVVTWGHGNFLDHRKCCYSYPSKYIWTLATAHLKIKNIIAYSFSTKQIESGNGAYYVKKNYGWFFKWYLPKERIWNRCGNKLSYSKSSLKIYLAVLSIIYSIELRYTHWTLYM